LEEKNRNYFSQIDEYLEKVLNNMSKHNQEESETYRLIKNYLYFDIDSTDLYEELVILSLLLRHFKDKILKNIFSKILINKVLLNSPHIYEFFAESKQDNLELYKYIAII
jgi:hypothetical protein